MRLLEWLWRSDALTQAREATRSLPKTTRLRLTRARLATELADRVLDPVDPLSAPAAALALSIYREAAYWALLAQDDTTTASNVAEAFTLTAPAILRYAAGSDAELQAVRSALAEHSFITTAEDEPQASERNARLAKAFVHALIARQLGPERALRRVLVQRWLRSTSVALLLLGGALATKATVDRLDAPPDLALRKPWRASSKLADCEPENMRCANKRTAIFFHTLEQNDPWLEIDLGAPRRFAAVEVDNRDDCCPDRAIPLIFEVSDNQRVWKKIARRDEPFRSLRQEFSPVTARYLRLRVPRRVAFHLERVGVFAR